MTESGIGLDMEIEKIHDIKGRGNSTQYLVKLIHKEDLIWIRGRDVRRRDLVLEFQRSRLKESRSKRQLPTSQPAIPPEDYHAQPAIAPQNAVGHSQPPAKKPRSQASRSGVALDLRAYFKQFGNTDSRLNGEKGLSVANINIVKSETKPKSNKKTANNIVIESKKTTQGVVIQEVRKERETAQEEPIDVLYNTPENTSQPQQLQQSQIQCSICKETDPEKLTNSLCNHSAFCYQCIIHLLVAESSSECSLCKNMHSSFLKMINPLVMHKLLMACAQFMNPEDSYHKDWQSYQEQKMREITQSLDAINTLALVLQQQRSHLEQQVERTQQAHQQFYYAREQLPNIQSQWLNGSQDGEAHQNH